MTSVVDDDEDGVRHLFTAPEAEHYLGIPQVTIRSWHHRKLLWPYGLDHRGRPMFDRDHLVSLRDRARSKDYHLAQKKPRRLRQQPRGGPTGREST